MRAALSGREITSLMRKHRIGIKALAARMGITQKRVRGVRANGIRGVRWCQDWIEAITSGDNQ